MRLVQRSDIVDYQTYEEMRELLRREVFAEKASRRIHVGSCFTFLFENALTIRYQVQEMMRAEKIVKEKDILHELETYNALLGGEGELGCTLMIEIGDPAERAEKLRSWLQLPGHIYATLEDGRRVRPTFDPSQIGAERLSSVQYLKFPVGGAAPVAVGIDLPGMESETRLSKDQRAALTQDMSR
ncbi:MAG: hypothetical protein H6Q05_885 [Acidobacteria bacterium]|nr:hypothetical protein [Acidobacteriota bacterium]